MRGSKRLSFVTIGFFLSLFCVVYAYAGPTSLRTLANGTGVYIGSVVEGADFDDPLFRARFAREFNILTVSNDLKWPRVHPSRNVFDFRRGDEIVGFAADRRMALFVPRSGEPVCSTWLALIGRTRV
jgi:GH35 family endo-1,4-beta-xylanase